MSFDENAVIAIGTVMRFSSTRRAVTTISSRPMASVGELRASSGRGERCDQRRGDGGSDPG
jgi:hypothetical protein